MNIPFILDIATGLIFIYLILSLLASEIQELIATLLQWRAKHLKQAIEILLAGENVSSQSQTSDSTNTHSATSQTINQSKELATYLYNHPLLRSLNQEAKGFLGQVGVIVSRITRTSKVFAGNSSGPSYIPAESFATTLLQTFRTEELIQKLSEYKLGHFISYRILEPLQAILNDLRGGQADEQVLERQLSELETELERILQDFRDRKITLFSSFNQSATAVRRFIAEARAILPEDNHLNTIFLKRIDALEVEIPALLKESGPTIIEVVSELNNMGWVARLLNNQATSQVVLDQLNDPKLQARFQEGYALLQNMKAFVQEASQGREDYQAILTQLSPYLQDSFLMLAKRAQNKIETIEQGAAQLEIEVGHWFDRSMDRTSGVYKRNAKGVAILIGFILAVTTNTDTLNMINRLSKDSILRTNATQAANQLVTANPGAIACLSTAQTLAAKQACSKNDPNSFDVNQAIETTSSLPIGWNSANFRQQWQPIQFSLIPILPSSWLSVLKMLLGWLISGIAISMGAPFWFKLLNKIVNIRNTGKPPEPTVPEDQA